MANRNDKKKPAQPKAAKKVKVAKPKARKPAKTPGPKKSDGYEK